MSRTPILTSRFVKLWKQRDPAFDAEDNGNVMLCLAAPFFGCGVGLVTPKNRPCDYFRVFVRSSGVTCWLWRFGFGVRLGQRELRSSRLVAYFSI